MLREEALEEQDLMTILMASASDQVAMVEDCDSKGVLRALLEVCAETGGSSPTIHRLKSAVVARQVSLKSAPLSVANGKIEMAPKEPPPTPPPAEESPKEARVSPSPVVEKRPTPSAPRTGRWRCPSDVSRHNVKRDLPHGSTDAVNVWSWRRHGTINVFDILVRKMGGVSGVCLLSMTRWPTASDAEKLAKLDLPLMSMSRKASKPFVHRTLDPDASQRPHGDPIDLDS